MKIVCAACGTRYSIDDSRVAGRSFKIRCKQCAHVIVLPGSRPPPAEPAGAGTWHVVINGMPRPIGIDDLRQLHAAGVLDERSLVWREGFDDWRELGSVDELHGPGSVSVEIRPESGMESTAVDTPKAGADARTDVSTGPEPEHRPEPAPLRGVRHENSVLFSLGNLARLAAPAPATAPPTGRTEGSGLLDIRALARSLAPVRTERSSVQSVELPVHGELPFTEPAVLIPISPPRRDRRLVWALAATAGALAVVTVIFVVIVLCGGTAAHTSTPPAPPATPDASPPPTASGEAPGGPASPEPSRTQSPLPARHAHPRKLPRRPQTGQIAGSKTRRLSACARSLSEAARGAPRADAGSRERSAAS